MNNMTLARSFMKLNHHRNIRIRVKSVLINSIRRKKTFLLQHAFNKILKEEQKMVDQVATHHIEILQKNFARTSAKRVIVRLFHGKLFAAFQCWKQYGIEFATIEQTATRLIKRWQQRGLSRSFYTWYSFKNRMKHQREVTCRVIRQMQHLKTLRVFRRWQDHV